MARTATQASTTESPAGSRHETDCTSPQGMAPSARGTEAERIPAPVLAPVAVRDAKRLQRKGRTHLVTPASDGSCLLVVSGASGRVYRVTPISVGALCTCAWGEHRRGTACSHMLACYAWAAAQQDLALSAWGALSEAARQHRLTQAVADVYVTLRRSR